MFAVGSSHNLSQLLLKSVDFMSTIVLIFWLAMLSGKACNGRVQLSPVNVTKIHLHDHDRPSEQVWLHRMDFITLLCSPGDEIWHAVALPTPG